MEAYLNLNKDSQRDLAHTKANKPEKNAHPIENWNEVVIPDEELLDTHWCDDEWEIVQEHPEFNAV